MEEKPMIYNTLTVHMSAGIGVYSSYVLYSVT